MAAGREVEMILRLQQMQDVDIAKLGGLRGRHHILVVDHAAGMGQQFADRDGIGGGRQRRQPLAHAVVEVQPPVLDEQEDCRRRELLGHRGQPIIRGRCRRLVDFEIGQSIPFVQDSLAVTNHENRSARYVALIGLHDGVDRGVVSHRS